MLSLVAGLVELEGRNSRPLRGPRQPSSASLQIFLRQTSELTNLVSACDQDCRDSHRRDDRPMSLTVSMSRKEETSETHR